MFREFESIFQSLTLNGAVSESASKRLEQLRLRLTRGEASVVVIGQFKRGKSTLINALIGETVVPTGVLPLTSIVTVLRSGEKSVEVKFETGESRSVGWNEIESYVTESYNPNNIKSVSEVEIRLPSPLLKNGIKIVDTPGVGSVHDHNTQVTLNYLPEADLAIFVLSVDQPLSRNEVEFLQQAKPNLAKIVFALNKSDYVTASEKEEISNFIRKNLIESLSEQNIQIFSLSAREGVRARQSNDAEAWEQSGVNQLEKLLMRISGGEKAKTLEKSCALKAISVVEQELSLLRAEESAFKMNVDELVERLKQVKEFALSLDKTAADLQPILRAESKGLIEAINQFSTKREQECLDGLAMFCEEFLKEKDGAVSRVWAELEPVLSEKCRLEVRRFGVDLRDECQRLHSELSQSQRNRVRGIYSNASDIASKAFGVPIELSEEDEVIEKIGGFGFSKFRIVPMVSWIAQGFLGFFPVSWLKKYLNRSAMDFAKDVVSSNFESHRWEYVKAFDLIYRKRTSTVLDSVRSLKKTLLFLVKNIESERVKSASTSGEAFKRFERRSILLDKAKADLVSLSNKTNG